MPEGPEVTFLAEQLAENFVGSYLQSVINYAYNKPLFLDTNTLHNTLPSRIKVISNIGKIIYFVLENGYCFTIQLGIDGDIKINRENISHDKIFHQGDKIKFITNVGSFTYNTNVNYGHVTIFGSTAELEKKLEKLGFDIAYLDKISFDEFKRKMLSLATKNTIIADLLLEQSFVAGVGNYIRAEVLFLAKIHPYKKVKDLTTKEIKDLKKYIFEIYNENLLSLQNNKPIKFRIYGKGDKLKRKNRTIYYDEKVQILN